LQRRMNMEKKTSARERWINIGYELFSEDGPEGIQIERLARILELNKSGFYHYFGTLDEFIIILMEHHLKTVKWFCNEISKLSNITPDYINLLMENKMMVMFHVQLSRNGQKKLFNQTFENGNQLIDRQIAPLWSEYLGLESDRGFSIQTYRHIRDIFNSRVNYKNFTHEFIIEVAEEFRSMLKKVQAS